MMGKYSRRLMLIIMAVVCSVLDCFADNVNDEDMRHDSFHFRFGIRGALNFGYFDNVRSTFHAGDEDNSNVGGALGLAVRYENLTHWYFESGIVANYLSGTSPMKILPSEHSDYTMVNNCEISRFALQLPLLAGYKFSVVEDVLSMSVFLGPLLSVGIAGDVSNCDNLADNSLYGDKGIWRRFNVAATFGLSFEIKNNFTVAVSGNLGMNSMPRTDIFMHNNSTESSAQVSAIYWFSK